MQIFTNILLVIIALFLFCLIISIHEFGHFIMAKLFKVKVNEFSIGMGPLILKKKKGETQYSVRLFPIGGYCSMEGEDESSTDPNSFGMKPAYQRALIVVMGAVFNLILGFIIMMIISSQQSAFTSTTIAQFKENSTTHESGLQIDDTIAYVDGYKINNFNDLNFAFSMNQSARTAVKEGGTAHFDITVKRNGEYVELQDVVFNTVENEGSYSLELDFKVYAIEKTFFTLMKQSFDSTVSTARMVWGSLIGLIMGKFSITDMSGPLGIVSVVTETAAQGLRVSFIAAVNNILYIMALITVNLGIFNLIIFPALDGGRLLFILIEMISRKKVPEKYEAWLHNAGFVLLMLVMLFVTFNDVFKLLN